MANAKPLYRNVSLIMADLIIEEIPLNIEINWDARHGGTLWQVQHSRS